MIPNKNWSTMRKLMMLGAMAGGKLVEDTATGNPLTFITDKAKPLKSLLIPFSPRQEGSGDPSPQNVRSILPWDGLKVWQAGKNLANMQYGNKVPSVSTGQMVDSNGWSTPFIPIDTSTSYYLSRNSITGNIYVLFYDSDYNFIRSVSTAENAKVNNLNGFSSCSYIKLRNDSASTATMNIQLEEGQTATAYEAPNITETDISFPSPVYGGTLDVVSGVLTVDKAYALLNDVDKWTQLTAGQTVDFSYEQDFERKLYDGSLTGLTCSAFIAVANQNVAYCRWRGATSLKFGIKNGNSMATPLTLEDVKQMATDGEIAICYDIEPQTVQLTAEQITAIKGQNTLWSDANGSMTAVFLKKG